MKPALNDVALERSIFVGQECIGVADAYASRCRCRRRSERGVAQLFLDDRLEPQECDGSRRGCCEAFLPQFGSDCHGNQVQCHLGNLGGSRLLDGTGLLCQHVEETGGQRRGCAPSRNRSCHQHRWIAQSVLQLAARNNRGERRRIRQDVERERPPGIGKIDIPSPRSGVATVLMHQRAARRLNANDQAIVRRKPDRPSSVQDGACVAVEHRKPDRTHPSHTDNTLEIAADVAFKVVLDVSLGCFRAPIIKPIAGVNRSRRERDLQGRILTCSSISRRGGTQVSRS